MAPARFLHPNGARTHGLKRRARLQDTTSTAFDVWGVNGVVRRGEAFELGCGDGSCDDTIGAVEASRLAPLTAPDTLRAGQELRANQWLLSKNRQFGLVMQGDGNLVIYNQGDGNGFWDMVTAGSGATHFALQTDGNLVLYAGSRALWNTETNGRGSNVSLTMQNDGNLVLYQGGAALWDSHTMGGHRNEEKSFFEDVVSTFEDIVSKVAPFVQLAISFVPGVGAVVNGAIAAGISLAEGNSITDALLSGTMNALPGGPLVKAAFDVGVGIVKGDSVSTIALNTARDNLPGGAAAKAAFDVAVSLAVGQQVQQGNLAAVQVLDTPTGPKMVVPSVPVGPPAFLSPLLSTNKARASGITLRSISTDTIEKLRLELVRTEKGKAELAAKKARKVALGVAGAGALGAAAWLLL